MQAEEARSVQLLMENPVGRERKSAPITVGVPFPAGELNALDDLDLVDETGASIPCQVKSLASWRDGSLRWVLLDYQAHLSARERKSYSLRFGQEVQRTIGGAAISIREDDTEVEVTTDRLRFCVPKKRFKLFETLYLDGKEVISAREEADLIVVDDEGTEYRASRDPDFNVEVEEKGALRSVIKLSGKHVSSGGKSFLDYVLKIHVYAHSSFLKIRHTFINKERPEEGVKAQAITLRLGLNLDRDSQRMVVYLPPPPRGTAWGAAEISRLVSVKEEVNIKTTTGWRSLLENPASLDDDRSEYSLEGKLIVPTGMMNPWLDVSDSFLGLTTKIHRAQENFPKGLVSEGNRIEYVLWPPWADLLQLNQGMAKTHEILLNFHADDVPVEARRAELDDREMGVHAVIPFEWYRRCKALRLDKVLAYQPAKYPRFELLLKNLLIRRMPQDWPRGMLDYGDDLARHYMEIWDEVDFGPRGDVWSNNEYDYIFVSATQFARTGDCNNFEDVLITARHLMDVDFIHYSQDPLRAGGVSCHSYRHTTGHVVPSHMWTEGLLAYYYMTGDPDALEVAIAIGENLLRFLEHRMEVIKINSREGGWPLVSLCALYEATLDERFLDGARQIVDYQVQVNQQGKFFENDSTFGIAIALMGLARYHGITQEERVKRSFLEIVDWWVENRYVPEGVPCYVWQPDRRISEPHSFLLFPEALAYAYDLTGEERYVDVGMRELEYHVEYAALASLLPNRTEQMIGMFYRTVINFLKAADEAGRLKILDYRY